MSVAATAAGVAVRAPSPVSSGGRGLEDAIGLVQQCLNHPGLTSEWTSALAARLRPLADGSPDLRKVLERHGWTVASTARGGTSGGYFRGPPDRERLLRDLAAAAADRRLPAQPEDLAHRSEERRFERQYILEEKPVGEGTYGAVFRARCTQTQRTVAVKRVKTENEDEGVPSTAIREVAVLKTAEHPHIVKLLDVVCTPGKLHLVFEFVSVNLKQHMKRYGLRLEPNAVRSLQHQLMLGIDFCHAHRIIHRDLKPQNILVDAPTPGGGGHLKIADFGMARAFCVPVPRYTHEVVTTWYRAPEILFGTQEYSLPVDVWSAGCILGELATGAALFHGDSEIDTIFQIFRKLGTPTEVEWPGLASLPDFKPTFPKWRRRPWEDIRGAAAQLGPAGTQLLDDMLRYDPLRRTSAKRSLNHAYFVLLTGSRGDVAQERERLD